MIEGIQDTWKQSITGLLASAGSITVSTATSIEPWLRVISLIVGIAVGCVSFWSIYRNVKRKDAWHRRHDEHQ